MLLASFAQQMVAVRFRLSLGISSVRLCLVEASQGVLVGRLPSYNLQRGIIPALARILCPRAKDVELPTQGIKASIDDRRQPAKCEYLL
jgi:hypothetical protein